MSVKLNSGTSLVLVTTYRLHIIPESTFFKEFIHLLETLSGMEDDFIMSDDINVHLNTYDSNVSKLNDNIDSFNFTQ